MSDEVKLIIEIPKNDFKKLVNPYQHNEVWCNRLKRMVMNGTPLEEELHREKEQAYYLGYEDGRKALIDDAKAEINEEREFARDDFRQYKIEVLGVDPETVDDELPHDDFHRGMERVLEIIDNIGKAESEGVSE